MVLATVYGTDGPEIESRSGTRFSAPDQIDLGALPSPCTKGTRSFSGVERPGVALATRTNPAPNLCCRICGKKDTLEHRIIDWGEGEKKWMLTKQRIAQMLKTDPGRIRDGWLTCPQFTLWD